MKTMCMPCGALLLLAAACGSKLADTSVPDAGTWTNATANLAGMQSGCGNMALIVSRPDTDMLVAGVVSRGLWASANGASTWSPLGQGGGSDAIENGPTSIEFDPIHHDTFWESGLYVGGGVFRTDNDGVSFLQLGTVAHNDQVSVDFSDPARKTLLAGGHESGKLYLSTDGGGQWTDIGGQLPAGAGNTSFPLVIDSQTYLLGTWGGTASGIYRTSNGGVGWSLVSSGAIGSRALLASDGTIYWLLDNNLGLIHSTDQGEHWTKLVGPYVFSSSGGGVKLIELPDGRIVSISAPYLIISADHGTTWRFFGPLLQTGLTPGGIAHSPFRKAIYLWKNDCGPVVLPDAIQRFDFDYQAH